MQGRDGVVRLEYYYGVVLRGGRCYRDGGYFWNRIVGDSIVQGSQKSLISLNPLEFWHLFSRPGNSLNIAVFVIISLNPLENIRSSGHSSKLLPLNYIYFPKFCLLMMLRFLPHDLWELPRLTHVWINPNKYPHYVYNLHIKRFKKKSLNSEVLYLNVLEFCPDKTLWTLIVEGWYCENGMVLQRRVGGMVLELTRVGWYCMTDGSVYFILVT